MSTVNLHTCARAASGFQLAGTCAECERQKKTREIMDSYCESEPAGGMVGSAINDQLRAEIKRLERERDDAQREMKGYQDAFYKQIKVLDGWKGVAEDFGVCLTNITTKLTPAEFEMALICLSRYDAMKKRAAEPSNYALPNVPSHRA